MDQVLEGRLCRECIWFSLKTNCCTGDVPPTPHNPSDEACEYFFEEIKNGEYPIPKTYGSKEYVCPNCSSLLNEAEDECCKICGQKIDWDGWYYFKPMFAELKDSIRDMRTLANQLLEHKQEDGWE